MQLKLRHHTNGIKISQKVNENITFEQRYPNGFIDKKAVLPSDFCELGIELFKNDLVKFEYHAQEIIESLKEKSKKKVMQSLLFHHRLLEKSYNN